MGKKVTSDKNSIYLQLIFSCKNEPKGETDYSFVSEAQGLQILRINEFAWIIGISGSKDRSDFRFQNSLQPC